MILVNFVYEKWPDFLLGGGRMWARQLTEYLIFNITECKISSNVT